jgi:hypothetical protein
MTSPESLALSADERAEPLVRALLESYRGSQRGRTGKGVRDFSLPYDKLVHDIAKVSVADQKRGEAVLERLKQAGIVRWTNKPFGGGRIKSVFVIAAQEEQFFAAMGVPAPAAERQALIDSLKEHRHKLDGTPHSESWKEYLREASESASEGRAIEGLPNDRALHDEVITGMVAVIRNNGPVSLRRLGAIQLNDSKQLASRRTSIERLMEAFLPLELASLEAWQVEDTAPMVRLFGPLGVELPGEIWVGPLSAESPYTLSEQTLTQALRLSSNAQRCICIENQDTFHDAITAGCKDLLIQTSYPSRSVVRLLQMLPPSVALFHWGDTDPWGFDILRALRQRTGKRVQALHMTYRSWPGGKKLNGREYAMIERMLADPLLQDIRPELAAMKRAGNKGKFEQESLPKNLLQSF